LKAGLESIDFSRYHSMNEYYTGFDVRYLVDEEAIGDIEPTGVVLLFVTWLQDFLDTFRIDRKST